MSNAQINLVLESTIGIPGFTVHDLDLDNPVDHLFYLLANEASSARGNVARSAGGIKRDLERTLNQAAGQLPSSIASSSDFRNHEAAVAALEVLRGPLESAAKYAREARNK
ncbi:hypothetical protein GCM10010174_25960 [Kutzneria viridogrisea]|uniref:Uncharacterized protein n=1 Tax=Kutzneria viridogrisea TaxID=47990 RepID=A0ABR6BS60_9PSEU|nr:hypothetical protein [Kutzneria viridogrisea]